MPGISKVPALGGAVKSRLWATTALNTLVSDSFTPDADSTLIVLTCITLEDGGSPVADFTVTNTHSMKSGTPGTWRQASTEGADGGTTSLRVSQWYAKVGSSPGAGTITVTRPAGTLNCSFIAVFAWLPGLADDPVGQVFDAADAAGGTTYTGTLPGAPSHKSLILGDLSDHNGGNPITPPTDTIELSDTADATDGSTFETFYKIGVSPRTAYQWSGLTNTAFAHLANVVEYLEETSSHPHIATVNVEIGTSLGSANSQTLPTGSASGDLIVAFIGNDTPGATNISVSTGWTILDSEVQGSNVIKGAVAVRILDGTTGNNILAVTGAAQDYVVTMVRIPTGEHGAVATSDVKIAKANAASGNTNPPSLDAGSSKDWLWIACAIVDMTTSDAISAIPTGYLTLASLLTKSANSTSSVGLGIAYKRATAQTEDPGTFTNNTQEWIGFTVAVPPVAPVGGLQGNFFAVM